jgi:hypothetical protein
MSISKDLFLAILSMDSYNRGYAAGIGDTADGLGSSSDGSISIGNAEIIFNLEDANLTSASVAAGFYAIAYEVNDDSIPGLIDGDTVISYRGTDGENLALAWELAFVDFPIWSGDYDEPQLQLASQFYQSVAETNNSITLTGHSLAA